MSDTGIFVIACTGIFMLAGIMATLTNSSAPMIRRCKCRKRDPSFPVTIEGIGRAGPH